jgi:hypothetical protein
MNPIPVSRPPAWEVLERALTERRAVRARYHGHERVLCPHALGWKNGRAKVLAYQSGGTTSLGALPTGAQQRWRSMFVDDIEHPTITDDHWETADNYSPDSNCIDHLAVHVARSVK